LAEKTIAEQLQEILKELEAEIPEIEGSSIVSAEGLPIASALPRDIDEVRIAAITATMFSMGERASNELRKGTLDQVIVRSSEGILISMAAGENAVLTVSAMNESRLGILLLYSQRAVTDIVKVLSKD